MSLKDKELKVNFEAKKRKGSNNFKVFKEVLLMSLTEEWKYLSISDMIYTLIKNNIISLSSFTVRMYIDRMIEEGELEKRHINKRIVEYRLPKKLKAKG